MRNSATKRPFGGTGDPRLKTPAGEPWRKGKRKVLRGGGEKKNSKFRELRQRRKKKPGTLPK